MGEEKDTMEKIFSCPDEIKKFYFYSTWHLHKTQLFKMFCLCEKYYLQASALQHSVKLPQKEHLTALVDCFQFFRKSSGFRKPLEMESLFKIAELKSRFLILFF